METDFVNEEITELDYKQGFFYKPTTAAEENEWIDEYISVENGKAIQDFSKLNKCKLRNLVKVPYTKEIIKDKLGIEKEWPELNHEQRWTFLGKLRPTIFNEIIKAIDRIDKVEESKKKD